MGLDHMIIYILGGGYEPKSPVPTIVFFSPELTVSFIWQDPLQIKKGFAIIKTSGSTLHPGNEDGLF